MDGQLDGRMNERIRGKNELINNRTNNHPAVWEQRLASFTPKGRRAVAMTH